MIAWTPQGPLLSFTADTTAPTSIQLISKAGSQTAMQVKIDNTDGTDDVVVGWGQSDAEAKLNAAAASNVINCCFIMHSTIQVITVPNGCYMSGISGAAAIVKAQIGVGG